MSVESLQNSIRSCNKEIDELNAEIRELNKEMDRVLNAQSQTKQREGNFLYYLSREKTVAAKVSANERVKIAVGFGNRMNSVLAGAKYRSAMSSIDAIKKALVKRKSEIEARIAQCKRRIITLQDKIRSLKLQLSVLQ